MKVDAAETPAGARTEHAPRPTTAPGASVAVAPPGVSPLALARKLSSKRGGAHQAALMAGRFQRECGNRAVATMLSRDPTPPATAEAVGPLGTSPTAPVPTGSPASEFQQYKEQQSVTTRESLTKRQGGLHGSAPLTKGTMEWWLAPFGGPDKQEPSAKIQIKFTPKPGFGPKTITFLQTVHTAAKSKPYEGMPQIDILRDQYVPFYGAGWNPKTKRWDPEGAPEGYENEPSGSTDPAAYLYDEPVVYPGMVKKFESVAVVPETSEILGSLSWGVDEDGVFGAQDKDSTDRPTAGFLVAVDYFYAKPATVGPDPERVERYDAILDGFQANTGGFAGVYNASQMTAEHEKQLTPTVTKMLADRTLVASIGGFADANEADPMGTSEARASEIGRFFVQKGVPETRINLTGFGAAWAQFAPSGKETRNRRVQIRLRR